MTEIQNPHDAFFKGILAARENGKSFVVSYQPMEIVELIDADSTELVPCSYVPDHLKEFFADVMLRTRTRNGFRYLYHLFEHKSCQDRYAVLQILLYMALHWTQQEDRAEGLNLIVPTIFYHGDKPWSMPKNLIECFPDIEEVFIPYIPAGKVNFIDLSTMTDKEVKGINAVQAMIKILMPRKPEDIISGVRAALEALGPEANIRDLRLTIAYISYTKDIEEEQLYEITSELVSEEASKMVKTVYEQGIDKGIERGLERGRLEGKLETLREILEIRFGSEGLDLMSSIRAFNDL
ncbi:MAG: Rpn family recombination-promoting nuclease/putative transposase, partial [Planctomycetes bacterium]|nr:Rpn family recombination-promoting nuclease/putative transposase [Planctomycetota bacterium]